MWSKITNALKSHSTSNKGEHSSSVMSKVFEQHPNLSIFHPNESRVSHPSPPPSPSVHSKRDMFKRMSKGASKDDGHDADSQRAPSPAPFKLTSTISKKASNSLNHHNSSQLSLNISTAAGPEPSQGTLGRSSLDMLHQFQDFPSPSEGTAKSTKESRRRPSLKLLRRESSKSSPESLRIKAQGSVQPDLAPTPELDTNFNSVRPILRDPHTPGTGQSVRFFSPEAFKVFTPDQSTASNSDNKSHPAIPEEPSLLLEKFDQSDMPSSSTPPSIKRSSPKSKSSRPTVAEIFSPLNSDNSGGSANDFDASLSLSNPIMVPGSSISNLFDVSNQLDISSFQPPGLDFDIISPNFSLDSFVNEQAELLSDGGDCHPKQMMSTPYKPKDVKGKEKDIENEETSVQITAPKVVDDTIFHAKEKSLKLSSPFHERAQSPSFSQTMFFSMASEGDKSSATPEDAVAPSTEHRLASSESQKALRTSTSAKMRTRSLSDTVFQTMLRSSSSQPRSPEDDINDESTTGIVVYSGGTSEPDPFSAHANTYYTPQTMIPTTPPKGILKHGRKTSKEESLIISLQTQLALKTELCEHYETDLKARDELVEILGKKLANSEKDDIQRKITLRTWKKKVQELERLCRQLEESAEDSKQERVERSVMDEASSEALRMLHGQITTLEREKNEWLKREQGLHEKVETLTHEKELERDKFEDTLQQAREQATHLAHDLQERNDRVSELEQERQSTNDNITRLEEKLRTRDAEISQITQRVLEGESEVENLREEMSTIQRELAHLVNEQTRALHDAADQEDENKAHEDEWLKREQELREEVETLTQEKELERDEFEDALQQAREQAALLAHDLQERNDRVSELEQERQFTNDNITRLEEKLRTRDAEISQITQRVLEQESEVENLHEEISTIQREHAHLVNEQTRALRDAADQEDESKARVDLLVRGKAEADVEIKASRDRIVVLKEEVEQLRRHVHSLQQESADKEVKIVQMMKQHSLDKEDLQGLNIALDSKQQELQLLKRKYGVKGTAGSTPAQPSKVSHRRESSFFAATPLPPRPPSVISDSGTDTTHNPKRKVEISPTSAKVPALGKSTRVNGSGTSSRPSSANKTVVRAGMDGSIMGPPILKHRPSIGTPTPSTMGLSHSRSSSARGLLTTPSNPHRRVSSVNSERKVKTKISRTTVNASPAPSVLEQDEKENVLQGTPTLA